MVEEGAQLAQTLQQIASGDPTWTPKRNDKRFNDRAWTENTFYKGMLQGYMAWSQSLQNFAEKAGFEAKETGRAKFLLSQISEAHLRPQIFYSATLRQSKRPSIAEARPFSMAIRTSWRTPSPGGRFHRKWTSALSRSAKISQ
jgi:hypothetical protein